MNKILMTSLVSASAFAASVSAVSFAQRTDGSRLVDISYSTDTAGTVSVECSLDNGSTWSAVPSTALAGAIGSVTPGSHSILYTLPVSVDADAAKFRVNLNYSEAPVGMSTVSAGTFYLGAGTSNPVTLTHDYFIGQHEVTNAEYMQALNWAKSEGLITVVYDAMYGTTGVWAYGVKLFIVGGFGYLEILYNTNTGQFYLNNPTFNGSTYGPGFAYPGGYDSSNHPVKQVSWYGAACYCDWISMMEGRVPYYSGNWAAVPTPNNPYLATGYRLPTEAEWEFAACGAEERAYPWGNTAPTCSEANFNPTPYCVGWSRPVATCRRATPRKDFRTWLATWER